MAELELDPRSRYEQASEGELLTSVVLLAFRSGEQQRSALLRAAVAAVAALVRLARPTGTSLEVLSLVERWVTGEIGGAELRAPVWSAQALNEGALGLLVLARLALVSNPHLITALQQVLDWLASATSVSGSEEAAQAVRRAVPYALLERAASAWARTCEVSER
jgi:hypothetical protein